MRDEEGNVKADPTSQVFQKNELARQTVMNVQNIDRHSKISSKRAPKWNKQRTIRIRRR